MQASSSSSSASSLLLSPAFTDSPQSCRVWIGFVSNAVTVHLRPPFGGGLADWLKTCPPCFHRCVCIWSVMCQALPDSNPITFWQQNRKKSTQKLLLDLVTSYASHPTVWRSPHQMSAINAINNITMSNCQQLLAGHQWNALFPLTTEKKGVFVELSSLNWQGLLQPFDTGLAASHNGRHINLQMSSGKLKCQRFSQQPPGPCQRNNWSVHLLSPAKYSSSRTKTGRQRARKKMKEHLLPVCVLSSMIIAAARLVRLWPIRLNQSRVCLKAGHVMDRGHCSHSLVKLNECILRDSAYWSLLLVSLPVLRLLLDYFGLTCSDFLVMTPVKMVFLST